MLFSSISFLYFFLPIFLLVTFILPRQLRNGFLLLSSLFFYFVGEPKYIVLILISSIIDFTAGLWIGRQRGRPSAKTGLIISVFANLSLLFFFKYADFFISTINAAFKLQIPLLNIPLPLGISFYTFQTMSYTIDVYREKVAVQKNPLIFANYVSMFPQLVAGPIVRYETVAHELSNRTYSWDNLIYGTRRFVFGLAKKVLIANQLGELVSALTEKAQPTSLSYWVAALAFAMQIYFDFSGYSDMAIGLGRMIGFHFLENFNYPFIAKSISDFWRRWHISMTTWFREYIYIPLGGNRVSKGRWLFNIFAVWFCTGLWHGASWNFVLWGLFFAVFMVIEKLLLVKPLEKAPAFISHIYVLVIVTFSFVIFYNESLPEMGRWLMGMFGAGGLPLFSSEVMYHIKSYGLLLVLAVIGATPIPKQMAEKLFKRDKALAIAEFVACIGLLLLSTAYLVDSSFNPFLYFRF